jgi:hypothetical protein
MSFPASTAGPASSRPVTTRLRLAQQSAHFLLSTLSHIDMVHVVSFADSSVRAPLANSDEAGLVRATEANKCRLHAFIDSIRAHGASNFTSGFEEATKILNASARSSCANAVVLFTDDTPDDRRSERSLLSSVQSLNMRTRATFFVYSMGEPAPQQPPPTYLKNVACSTGGMWQRIPSDSAIAAVLRSFAEFYVRAVAAGGSLRPKLRWSEPYSDTLGSGPVATASMPVYSNGHLRGVVGVDFGLCEAYRRWGRHNVTTFFLEHASADACTPLRLSDDELELLRNETSPDGVCSNGSLAQSFASKQGMLGFKAQINSAPGCLDETLNRNVRRLDPTGSCPPNLCQMPGDTTQSCPNMCHMDLQQVQLRGYLSAADSLTGLSHRNARLWQE